MYRGIRARITEPELLGIDLDDDNRIRLHREILMRKPMLCGVFEEFYHTCMMLDRRYFGDTPGRRVELGSGVSLFKNYYPEVVTSDIKAAEHLDMVVDAQAMPFEAGSVRSFFGISFFHHLPDPNKFLGELLRTLAPGGGCVLIDTYHGPLASWFHKHVHASETYDKEEAEWASSDRGVMTAANQALTYIVFQRDRDRFIRTYSDLEIVYERPVPNYLRYLCSGGLNFRALLPDWCIGPLKLIEKALLPVLYWTAIQQVVVLRKRGRG